MFENFAWKEGDDFEDVGAIALVKENDFHTFVTKQENKDYLFVCKELHPEESNEKEIAHHYYVYDVPSRQWFSYSKVLIDQADYDALQDGDD